MVSKAQGKQLQKSGRARKKRTGRRGDRDGGKVSEGEGGNEGGRVEVEKEGWGGVEGSGGVEWNGGEWGRMGGKRDGE